MRAIRHSILVIATIVLAACGPGGSSSTPPGATGPAGTPAASASADELFSPVSVTFGVDSFGGAVPLYAAQQQGIFTKYGITATIDTYSVGLDTLNAALAGTADFGWAFDYGSLGAMAGDQLRYVAVLERTQPGFHQLALTSRVPSTAELGGKRLGIVEGTQQHYITLAYLDKLSIPRDSVELVPFGAVLEIVAAMRTGQVDAAWVFGQGVGEAQNIEGVQIVADDGEVLSGGRGILIATRKIVEEQPEVVERVLRALVEAKEWIDANDPVLTITSEYIANELKAPVDGVRANLENAEVTVSFNQDDVELLETFAEFRTGLNPDAPLDVASYLALDPLRAVDPELVTVE
ncbi:MAG TPA: ABC transporter substrate-binding protein [Candidatus Binatia bacterium]|nr:ABC transporter substrate-binding protein [Candidatus Binatia bacterium]